MPTAPVPAKTSTLALEEYTPDKPLLSSARAGWSSLLVRTYREPDACTLSLPAVPDPLVIVHYSEAYTWLERKLAGKTAHTHVGKGSIWFIPPEEPSQWQWKNRSAGKIATLHLHLDHAQLQQVAEQAAGTDSRYVELLDRFPVQDALLESIGLSLKGELETGNPGGRLYADTAGQMLAVQLLRHHATLRHRIREYNGGLPAFRLNRVIEFIHAHLDEEISLDTLGKLAEMSPYHFARLFKQSTGKSPYQFVIGLRMEKARQLLRETRLNVTQVAFQVGYGSVNQFFEAFRRYTGTTPLNYPRYA